MSDLAGIQLHYLSSIDDMMELKRWMGERRPVLGIDTETGGFDWWRQPLRMVQVGDAMTGWAIPFDDWKGVVKELIPVYDREIVFHNWKFDVLFLEHNGVGVPRRLLHDSEVLCHLENSARPKALKAAATRYIDGGFAAGQQKLDELMATEGWNWATIPIDNPMYWQYAALDPIMTARLWEMFKHHCTSSIYDIEIRSTDVLLRAERRGYRLDVEYCERVIPWLRNRAQQLRAWAKEAYGIKNLTSDMQVAKILEADGWEPTVFTDSGRPSLKKEVAQWIVHPIAQAMLECKHSEKMAGAYLENFVEYSFDGRVHAKINPIGTRTGRNSVTEPALQTLPRDDTVCRNAFIPSVGNQLVLCDYDQIEARAMVHFAEIVSGRHSELSDLFTPGGVDFFTGMARRAFQDPTIVKADLKRQRMKNGVYAKIYGSGIAKFSVTIGVSESEGGDFIRMIDNTFPEILGLQNAVAQAGDMREKDEGVAYIITPYGQRHVLSHREGTYKLLNYLVQGTAANMFKMKMVELDAAGIGDYLVLPVHDELDFDVPQPEIVDVQRIIQEVMPLQVGSDIGGEPLRVPISVGVDVVNRWGEKYEKDTEGMVAA